jgi:hypothetical protein
MAKQTFSGAQPDELDIKRAINQKVNDMKSFFDLPQYSKNDRIDCPGNGVKNGRPYLAQSSEIKELAPVAKCLQASGILILSVDPRRYGGTALEMCNFAEFDAWVMALHDMDKEFPAGPDNMAMRFAYVMAEFTNANALWTTLVAYKCACAAAEIEPVWPRRLLAPHWPDVTLNKWWGLPLPVTHDQIDRFTSVVAASCPGWQFAGSIIDTVYNWIGQHGTSFNSFDDLIAGYRHFARRFQAPPVESVTA